MTFLFQSMSDKDWNLPLSLNHVVKKYDVPS